MAKEKVLHVVTVVFNPAGAARRYKLHQDFVEHAESFTNVKVYVVELAFGNQKFQVTDKKNPRHLQLRTRHPMWYKENMVNIGVDQLLPRNWEYMAWIDADLTFLNENWVEQTFEALEYWDIVQPFEVAVDMGKRDNAIFQWTSFGRYFAENFDVEPGETCYDVPNPHPSKITPGFAWACTNKAWKRMGGLLDKCIVGSGDYHMAMALINRVQDTFHSQELHGYNRTLLKWQERVQGLRLGFVPGTILHHWHGDRKNRKYQERRGIIERHNFDPRRNTDYDKNGLLILVDVVADMFDDFVNYFTGRKEDN